MAVADVGLVPSLLQGVSQQPEGLRLPSQATTVLNLWGNPIDGLTKRPGSRTVAKVIDKTSLPVRRPKFHAIDRDPTERYVVLVHPDSIEVFTAVGGHPIPVVMTASSDYLSPRSPNSMNAPETFSESGTEWTLNPQAITPVNIPGEEGPLGWGTAMEIGTGAGEGTGGTYNQSQATALNDFWRLGKGERMIFSCFFKQHPTNSAEDLWLELHAATAISGMQFRAWFNWSGTILTTSQHTFTDINGGGTNSSVNDIESWVESMGNGWYRAVLKYTCSEDFLSNVGMSSEISTISFSASPELVYAWGAHLEYIAHDRDSSTGAVPYAVTGEEAIKLMTVQDYTYIANNTQIVGKASTTSASPIFVGSAFAFVKNAPPGTKFKIEISEDDGAHVDSLEWATWTDPTAVGRAWCQDGEGVGATACAANGGTWMPTGALTEALSPNAESMATKLAALYGSLPASPTGPSGVAAPFGAVIHFYGPDVIDYIRATTNNGSAQMIGFMGAETAHSVDKISDLPEHLFGGYRVRINQGSEDKVDDVFVEFIPDDPGATAGLSPGHWVETTPYAQQNELDATTMPHTLVRKQDDAAGTATGKSYGIYFEFNVGDWIDREVGDDLTNPDPAFVGQKINNLTFYRNRLGLVSGQDITFSGSGDYFNFYRTTTITLIDSDPFSTQVTDTEVSTIYNTKGFDRNLILFSDRGQFVLTGEPILSPTTVGTRPLYGYDSLIVPPATSNGKTVSWFTKQGAFTLVRELVPSQGATDVYDVTDSTEQAPKYIPGLVYDAASSSISNTLVCVGDGKRSSLFVYTWFYRGGAKLQSAWVEWDMSSGSDGSVTRIIGLDFIQDELFVLIERQDGIYVENIPISQGLEDNPTMGFRAHIDRRFNHLLDGLDIQYNAGANTSTLSGLPWDIPSGGQPTCVGTKDNPGGEYTWVSQVVATSGAHTVTFSGDLRTEEFLVGFEFDSEYTFSEPWRQQDTPRGQIVPSLREPYQVVGLALLVEDSGNFNVEVQPQNGALLTQEFRGTIEGIPTRTITGSTLSVNLATGVYRVNVGAKNNEFTLSIKSSSYLPARMVNAEWETETELRGRR